MSKVNRAVDLERLIAALGPADRLSFDRLSAAMYAVRFTGPTTVHWLNGRLQQIDLGAPIRLSIVEADPGGLDSEKPPGAR